MGGPKSSFKNTYLSYLIDDLINLSDKGQKSYNSSLREVGLSGWKRYKIQDTFVYPESNKGQGTLASTSNGNHNMEIKADFLPKASVFSGKIVFHNLNPIELGALLWAIKFSDLENSTNSPKHYHSLGFANPLGAGAVSFKNIKVKFAKYVSKENSTDIDYYQNLFENQMNESYRIAFGKEDDGSTNLWKLSLQIQYLLVFSISHKDNHGSEVKIYNTIDSETKEFVETNKEQILYQLPNKLYSNKNYYLEMSLS